MNPTTAPAITGNSHFFFLLIRLFLGYVFLSSGLCKLTHGEFAQLIGPPLLIDQLKEYGLELFGYIIACSQVIVGGLVMTQRFSLVGLIALVPINLGILSVTLSQQWTGTPYVNTFFLVLNVAALLYEFPALKHLILPVSSGQPAFPYSIEFFPGLRVSLGLLLLLIVTIVFTFFNNALVLLGGNIFFIGLGIYLISTHKFLLFQLITLICFFMAILSMTNGKFLMEINTPLVVLFGGATALGLLTWLLSLFRFGHRLTE